MGAIMTLTKKEIYLCKSTKELIVRDLDKDIINNPNHITRKYFTCYLDGSYGQEGKYEKSKEFVTTNKDNKKKMRQFVIQEFCKYIAQDGQTTNGYAQKVIVNHFNKSELETLNEGLISDVIDHFNLN